MLPARGGRPLVRVRVGLLVTEAGLGAEVEGSIDFEGLADLDQLGAAGGDEVIRERAGDGAIKPGQSWSTAMASTTAYPRNEADAIIRPSAKPSAQSSMGAFGGDSLFNLHRHLRLPNLLNSPTSRCPYPWHLRKGT